MDANLISLKVGHLSDLKIGTFFAGFDHDIIFDPANGEVHVRPNNRRALTGAVYTEMTSTFQRSLYIKARQGLSFIGEIHLVSEDTDRDEYIALMTEYNNLFASGSIRAPRNRIAIAAFHGNVDISNLDAEAHSICIYSSGETSVRDTIFRASELFIYVYDRYIAINATKHCSNIAVVSEVGNISISDSNIRTHSMLVVSGGDNIVRESDIVCDGSLVLKATKDYIQINSSIELIKHPFMLFTHDCGAQDEFGNQLATCGIRFSEGLELIGILLPEGLQVMSNYQYHHIHTSKISKKDLKKLHKDKHGIYIDADTARIVGGALEGNESIIIRTIHSVEVIPLILYNVAMTGGEFNESGILYLVSRLNAGIIDIDAGKVAIFIGALMKASVGCIKSEWLELLDTPDKMAMKQNKVSDLKSAVNPWMVHPKLSDLVAGQGVRTYLGFSELTSIDLGEQSVDLFYPYKSKNVQLRQRKGDVSLYGVDLIKRKWPVPTLIRVGSMAVVVDHDTTIESAIMLAKEDIMGVSRNVRDRKRGSVIVVRS